MSKPLADVVKAFLASLLDTGHAPAQIRAAFKECGFVTDPAREEPASTEAVKESAWEAHDKAQSLVSSRWSFDAGWEAAMKAREA